MARAGLGSSLESTSLVGHLKSSHMALLPHLSSPHHGKQHSHGQKVFVYTFSCKARQQGKRKAPGHHTEDSSAAPFQEKSLPPHHGSNLECWGVLAGGTAGSPPFLSALHCATGKSAVPGWALCNPSHFSALCPGCQSVLQMAKIRENLLSDIRTPVHTTCSPTLV